MLIFCSHNFQNNSTSLSGNPAGFEEDTFSTRDLLASGIGFLIGICVLGAGVAIWQCTKTSTPILPQNRSSRTSTAWTKARQSRNSISPILKDDRSPSDVTLHTGKNSLSSNIYTSSKGDDLLFRTSVDSGYA